MLIAPCSVRADKPCKVVIGTFIYAKDLTMSAVYATLHSYTDLKGPLCAREKPKAFI